MKEFGVDWIRSIDITSAYSTAHNTYSNAKIIKKIEICKYFCNFVLFDRGKMTFVAKTMKSYASVGDNLSPTNNR